MLTDIRIEIVRGPKRLIIYGPLDLYQQFMATVSNANSNETECQTQQVLNPPKVRTHAAKKTQIKKVSKEP